MLKKLIKYEWRATSRVLLPLYGAMILLALVNRLLWFSFSDAVRLTGAAGDIARGISMTVYVGVVVAAFVITFVVLIQRFYKSLLGDEGYLMFTLPVTVAHNIWAKTIVASIMSVLSGVAAIISVLVLSTDLQFWSAVFEELGDVFQALFSSAHYPLYALEFILLLILSMVGSMLTLYLCMAIGHLAKRHRVAASIGAYFGLCVLMQMIFSIFINFVNWGGMNQLLSNLGPYTSLHVGMLLWIAFTVADAGLCFFFTNYILKNKLNLE